MDVPEIWALLQAADRDDKFTEEQLAQVEQEVDRFTDARIAAMLSTTTGVEAEAETFLRQAYGVVGLEPPHIRWFDSPIEFASAPEVAPQRLDLLLITSIEVRIAAMVADRVASPIWSILNLSLDKLGDGVWANVGKLIEAAALASMGYHTPASDATRNVPARTNTTVPEIRASLWAAAGRSIEFDVELGRHPASYIERTQRLRDGVQAYPSAAWFALAMGFAQFLGPSDLLPMASFNELVSGYRLGRHEAWLVRKPIHLARDERGSLHADDGMCLRYRDGWGCYAWHGQRVSERLIMHPETLTLEHWLQERDHGVRHAILTRIGPQRFSEMAGGLTVENEQLVVDLGDRTEPTGYALYHRSASPRVCMMPWVLSQVHCANGCPLLPSCPMASELFIKQQD
jgi:hypothetical protein